MAAIRKFHFRLEPLLRLRRMEEERALGGLAQILLLVNEQEDIRRLSLQERAVAMRALEAEETGEAKGAEKAKKARKANCFNLARRTDYSRYLDRLTAQALAAQKKIEALQPDLRQEQEKVTQARRRRRLIELLKEREEERHRKHIYRLEKKELQEFNYRKSKNERAKAI